jgi:hypothetical protein
MKSILLFSIFIFILCSCKKPRTIKIIAKNAATEEPYAGLSYTVVSSRTTANGEKYRTEAEGVLDEHGEAIEEIKVKTGRSYSVRIGKLDNICYHNELHQYFDSPYDVEGTFTYKFAECAYLTLSINNIDCQDDLDKILYDLQPTYIPDYNNIIPTEKYGCYSNTFIESQVPSGTWDATWQVTKNGLTTFYDSSFVLAPNQHYNFIINY